MQPISARENEVEAVPSCVWICEVVLSSQACGFYGGGVQHEPNGSMFDAVLGICVGLTEGTLLSFSSLFLNRDTSTAGLRLPVAILSLSSKLLLFPENPRLGYSATFSCPNQ